MFEESYSINSNSKCRMLIFYAKHRLTGHEPGGDLSVGPIKLTIAIAAKDGRTAVGSVGREDVWDYVGRQGAMDLVLSERCLVASRDSRAYSGPEGHIAVGRATMDVLSTRTLEQRLSDYFSQNVFQV